MNSSYFVSLVPDDGIHQELSRASFLTGANNDDCKAFLWVVVSEEAQSRVGFWKVLFVRLQPIFQGERTTVWNQAFSMLMVVTAERSSDSPGVVEDLLPPTQPSVGLLQMLQRLWIPARTYHTLAQEGLPQPLVPNLDRDRHNRSTWARKSAQ